MESTEIGKPKICGVPRQNSRLLLLSAVLLILSGAAMLALRVGFAEQESVDRLFPQLAAILFVVTGGLLLFCRRRTELFVPVACVLTAAMCSGNDFAVKFATLAAFAALLLLVSAVGLRVNTRFSALPKWLGFPVFNLASAALSILAVLAGVEDTAEHLVTGLEIHPIYAPVLALVTRLPPIAVAVLNFSVEPQAVTADDAPRPIFKSAVQPGSVCFQTAAWILLLCGAGGLLKAVSLVPAAGFSLLFQRILFDLPLVAAALLLLQNDGRENDSSPPSFCWGSTSSPWPPTPVGFPPGRCWSRCC